MCQSEEFEVLGVTSGEDALAVSARGGFDLLLLDAAMPGIDGLEVCRILKMQPETRTIR